MEHSVLPWKTKKCSRYADSTDIRDDEDTFVACVVGKERAEFIVRAGNCHDGLLAACEKLLYNAELMALTVGVEQAKAAIKAAEQTG